MTPQVHPPNDNRNNSNENNNNVGQMPWDEKCEKSACEGCGECYGIDGADSALLSVQTGKA